MGNVLKPAGDVKSTAFFQIKTPDKPEVSIRVTEPQSSAVTRFDDYGMSAALGAVTLAVLLTQYLRQQYQRT